MTLYSQACPTEAESYAHSSYLRLLQSAVESGSLSVGDSVSLGTPFTISASESDSPVYYFPIITDGTIIATLRVYQNLAQTEETNQDNYTGILSPYLAEELNYLNEISASSETVLLYVDNGNIMARVGNHNELLVPCAEGDLPSGSTVEMLGENLRAVTPIDSIDTAELSDIQARAASNYLNLTITETQGSEDWCAAYVTAIILRYLDGSSTSPTAAGLMSYRNPSSTDTFSIDYVLSAGQMYGYSPTFIEDTLGSTAVFAQIDSSNPLYVSCRRYDSGSYYYHALALRGYSRTNDTYSIWNPWNSYYETMDMITKQYVASSTRTYTWVRTVYDW